MKWPLSIIAIGLLAALGFQASKPMSPATMHQASAATYENLATAIIAIRDTEDNLVSGILTHYYSLAQRELQAAMEAEGRSGVSHLEAAAREITNIASEGDKRVQAIRQRLLQAGHHHHTDAETDEDYIFIDSGEKKQMLDLATDVSKLGPQATEEQIETAMGELTSLFEAAMMEE